MISVPKNVQIMIVTKRRNADKIEEKIKLGHVIFGENYVQEALEKWTDLKKKYPEIKLHMIGHLQKNKVNKVVDFFDSIDSVDSIELAEKINSACKKRGIKMPIMIEVNISNEESKTGINIEKIDELISVIKQMDSIILTGIMALPEPDADTEVYIKMRELKEKYSLDILSMGTSDDYKLAIANGANMIRLGRKMFE